MLQYSMILYLSKEVRAVNRRMILFVLLFVLLSSMVIIQTPTSARPPLAGTMVPGGLKGIVVASEPLRIRSEPSNTSSVVANPLQEGETVYVIGRNSVGTWLLVQTQTGVIGWVGSPYVKLLEGNANSLTVYDAASAANLIASQTPSGAATAAEAATEEGGCGPVVSPTPLKGIKGIVVASEPLRVRSKPDSRSSEVASPLQEGEPVTVLGRNDVGTWLLIQTQVGVIGWSGSAYIKLMEGKFNDLPVYDANTAANLSVTPTASEGCVPTPTATPALTGIKGIVVSSDPLRIRSKPSTTSSEVAPPLQSGVPVTIVGRNSTGTWFVVQTQTGVVGWVGSAYVKPLEGNWGSLPVYDENTAPVSPTTG
jgi:uncharacterized protein YgiM (DUF1202 family)